MFFLRPFGRGYVAGQSQLLLVSSLGPYNDLRLEDVMCWQGLGEVILWPETCCLWYKGWGHLTRSTGQTEASICLFGICGPLWEYFWNSLVWEKADHLWEKDTERGYDLCKSQVEWWFRESPWWGKWWLAKFKETQTMVPTCFSGLGRGMLNKGTAVLAKTCVLERAPLKSLLWSQSIQYLVVSSGTFYWSLG